MRIGEAVRRAFVDFKTGILDDLGRGDGRGPERHDLVFIAMDDQGRKVELF